MYANACEKAHEFMGMSPGKGESYVESFHSLGKTYFEMQDAMHEAVTAREEAETKATRLEKKLQSWKKGAVQEALNWVFHPNEVAPNDPGYAAKTREIRVRGQTRKRYHEVVEQTFFVEIGVLEHEDFIAFANCKGEDFVETVDQAFESYKKAVL